MDPVTLIRQRYAEIEPLGDPDAGVSKVRDRLAPQGEGTAVLKRAREPAARHALSTELTELLRLDHPALRRVLAHSDDPRERTVVLEYIEGPDLGTFLRGDPGRASWCVEGVLRILVYLHASGRVHGDLKPDNILVSSRGVRLIDLGLVTPIGAQPRGGTPGFIPPEYRRGARTSVEGDLYSLGMTVRAVEIPLDKRLGRLVDDCTTVSPGKRPASADGALGMLGQVPRPVDRTGRFSRVGGFDALARVEEVLADPRGRTVAVEAPPGSGRTRLIRDALRDLIERGRPVVDVTLRGGHDPFPALARAVLPRCPEDPERAVALAAAVLARADVPLVVDDADQGDEHALPVIAATLAELGRGALVVVGADEALATKLSGIGCQRVDIGRLSQDEVTEMLAAAGAVNNPSIVRALHGGSRGRAGTCARLALDLADHPETGTADVEARARADLAPSRVAPRLTDLPIDEALTLAREALDDGAPGRAVELVMTAIPGLADDPYPHPDAASVLATAEAGRGHLEAAAAIAEKLGASASDALRLSASRWLERLGRYRDAGDAARPLLSSGEAGVSEAAAAVVAQSAFGLGDPRTAERVASEALLRGDLPHGLECRLRCIRSDAALTRGDPGIAIREAEAAQVAARRQDDPTLLPQALAREAAGYAQGGDRERARDLYQAAMDAALSAGDVVGLPPHILNLATAEHAAGELRAALERYQHAARLATHLGRTANRAAALVNWAGLLADLGAADEASQVVDDARAAALSAGSALLVAQAELVRASLVGRGSPERGRKLAAAARLAFLDCGASRQALEAELLDAELAADGGDAEPAIALVARSRQNLVRGGLAARATLAEARAHLLRGDLDQALRRAEHVSTLARADGDLELEARALSVAARVHGNLGTGAEQPLLMRSRESLGRVAARLPPGLRERFLQDPTRVAVMRPESEGPRRSDQLDLAPGRLLGLVGRLLLEGSERALLEAAVDQAVELVGAERAFLLRRRGTGEPYVAVSRNIEAIQGSGPPGGRFSRSVAERVLTTGEPVVTTSAADDPALGGARSVLDLGLRSILCVPIRSPAGVVGALVLDHRFESDRFGPAACELVQALADIIGVALENARLRQAAADKAAELERANEALSRDNERRAVEVERLEHLLEQGGALAGDAPGGMVGRSRRLRRAVEVARRVAPSNLPVLIEGQSGTGKELLARYVHDCSLRSGGPFLAINCGAVPETLLESELFGHVRGAFTGATRDHAGLFRAASGGTLLLDEIGEMSPSMQPRLLRVLQEGEVWPLGQDTPTPVDVRVVAATNRDLEREVEAGRFRRDLYFRLVGVKLVVPPLCQRLEDVPLLAEAMLERIAREPGLRRVRLSRDAHREMLRHTWPGNVRELEQALRRAVLMAEGDTIRAADLELTASAPTRTEALRGFDRDLVQRALQAAGGNRTHAARALGISRATLHRWLKRYEIE